MSAKKEATRGTEVKGCVLVVEDDPNIQQMVARAAQAEGL